jgi:hypothetical protein
LENSSQASRLNKNHKLAGTNKKTMPERHGRNSGIDGQKICRALAVSGRKLRFKSPWSGCSSLIFNGY